MPNTNKIAMKRYDKNKKKWDEIRIQSSADITLIGKEISVQNNLGAYHPGATIPAGTKLSDVLANLAKTATHPVYTAPTHQVTFGKDTDWSHYTAEGEKYPKGVIYDLSTGKHIAGQLIHTKITSVVTKNDAGDVSTHTITVKVNGTELTGPKIAETRLSGDKLTATKVIEYQSKPNDKITVEVHAEYAEGATKNDEHNTADPVGKIVAGSFDKVIKNDADLTFIAFEADTATTFDTAEAYRKAFEAAVADDSAMLFAEDKASVVSTLATKPRMIIAFPSKFNLMMLLSSGMNVTKLFSGSKTTATIKSYARFEEITGQDDITLYSGNELDVEYSVYDIKLGQTPVVPMNVEAMVTSDPVATPTPQPPQPPQPPQEKAKIYGVEWDGTETTEFTRTDDAVGFAAPQPAVANGTGSSPFDEIMPWKGMVRSTDPEAGELVAIPKFYYKWTKEGKKMKLQISEKNEEGFFCSPAHADRGDGKGERDVVYVGRYHSGDDFKSTTNVIQKTNITRETARTSIHALGENIWQWDFAMHWTISMLYLVEYASWDSQTKIGYGCSETSGRKENNGKTDSMRHHTGTTVDSQTKYGFTQYRNIEGLWDNVFDWMDGCYYNEGNLNVIMNPNEFSDTSGGTSVGTPVKGYPTEMSIPTQSNLEWALYPSAAGGSTDKYVPDYWNFISALSYPCLRVGGQSTQDKDYGLFFSYCELSSYYSTNIGCRLMKLP